MLRLLAQQLLTDVRHVSLLSACARSALSLVFALSQRKLFRATAAEPSYRDHVAVLPHQDAFGFASHRAYLVRGLSRRARGLAALEHYRNETAALDDPYHEAVYRQGGLRLWSFEHEETVFELRLMPGNDVMNEGGLSVTLFVNGNAAAVLSYSNVDPVLLGREPVQEGSRLVPFITRRQSTRYPFRPAFTAAFGRGTPAHLCIAALEGIALAQGSPLLLAIPARRHPAASLATAGRAFSALEELYDGFWRSLSGDPGQLAWSIPLPLQPTPLGQLDSNNRRRAGRLRAHQAEVRDAAFRTYRAHLLAPPPPSQARQTTLTTHGPAPEAVASLAPSEMG